MSLACSARRQVCRVYVQISMEPPCGVRTPRVAWCYVHRASLRGIPMTDHNHHGPARCLRCGRPLRAASSVSAGYGRWCRASIAPPSWPRSSRASTAAQVEKARELIADGGLVPAGGPGVFRAVSSDGKRPPYRTARPAGAPGACAARRRHARIHWPSASSWRAAGRPEPWHPRPSPSSSTRTRSTGSSGPTTTTERTPDPE